MMGKTICLLSVLMVISSPVFSQEKIGETKIEGRTVNLFNDQTWAYQSQEKTAGCLYEGKALSFCGSVDSWVRTPPPNAVINAQFRRTDVQYGQVIVEAIGAAGGLTQTDLRKSVIYWAAQGANIKESDVPILEEGKTTIDGKELDFIVYSLKYGSTPLVMANSYLVTENHAFQIMTYEIGTQEFTETHRKTNDDFFDGINFAKGDD